MQPFKADVEAIREHAREKMRRGAVTAAYEADREKVLAVLDEVLATELVCVLRYKSHYFRASGIHARAVAAEFLEHAQQEQQHADWIARRMVQLGGKPNFDPKTLSARSHSEFHECDSLPDMIRENLVAERIAIDTYTEIVRWLGDADPTTRELLVRILTIEEEHADDLANLLSEVSR